MSAALRSLDIKVLRSGAGTGDSLHARFLAMQLRQALFAGGFVSQPSLVQIGRRLTHEGGSAGWVSF